MLGVTDRADSSTWHVSMAATVGVARAHPPATRTPRRAL